MTLKAFAAKYGITPSFASKVAERTPHTATMERDNDYLEKDLYLSLMEIMREKIHEADKKRCELEKKKRVVKNIAVMSGILN